MSLAPKETSTGGAGDSRVAAGPGIVIDIRAGGLPDGCLGGPLGGGTVAGRLGGDPSLVLEPPSFAHAGWRLSMCARKCSRAAVRYRHPGPVQYRKHLYGGTGTLLGSCSTGPCTRMTCRSMESILPGVSSWSHRGQRRTRRLHVWFSSTCRFRCWLENVFPQWGHSLFLPLMVPRNNKTE